MTKKEEKLEIDIPEGLNTAADYDLYTTEESPEVNITTLLEQIDPQGEGIKAIDLVGESFTIMKLSKVKSAYDDQDYFYYAVIRQHKDMELRHTVFGGTVVVSQLDKVIASGLEARIVCTLIQVEGGEHDSYYSLL